MYLDKTLANGIRVIAEKNPTFRSVSLGVWVRTGSVLEQPQVNGISHFIEHMLFKGTDTRSALDISSAIDAIGGQLNAFTSKECTCFYVRLIDEHLPIGIELLSDMLLHSRFDPQEIGKEQGVVVEEIGMSMDNPEDYVHELLSATYFEGHPLGRPILGTRETVRSFDQATIHGYMAEHYTAPNTVVAVAGNFDEEQLMDLLEQHFGPLSAGGEQHLPAEYAPGTQRVAVAKRNIAQVHIALGMPGITMDSPCLYSAMVLNNVFGSSMSSRLFQTIREEHGLAYSVFSYPSSYRNTGMFTIYVGTNAQMALKALELVDQEIKKLLSEGLTEEEFQRGKQQLRGNYTLGLESTSNRMTAIGKNMTLLGYVQQPQEILDKIDAVTKDSLHECAEQLMDTARLSVAMVGEAPDPQAVQEIFA